MIGIKQQLNGWNFSMTQDKDMTYIEKVGGYNEDCASNHHRFKMEKMEIVNGKTVATTKCTDCGFMGGMEAAGPIGLEDLLTENTQPQPERVVSDNHAQQMTPEEIVSVEKKVQYDNTDSFWDSIKEDNKNR